MLLIDPGVIDASVGEPCGESRLPILEGRPVRVTVRVSLGPHLAATSLPRRTILLDSAVLTRTGDFERILVHELFHFSWVRLGNPLRREWSELLAWEWSSGVAGELGWSAEWRKAKLNAEDWQGRSPRWRRYICESYCDTAAWLYAGLSGHPEFTLEVAARKNRKAWFRELPRPVSI
jgi:hypothetical protein